MGRGRFTKRGDSGCSEVKQERSTITQFIVILNEKTSQISAGQPSISTGSRRDNVAQHLSLSIASNLKNFVVKKSPLFVQPQASNSHFPFDSINGIVL